MPETTWRDVWSTFRVNLVDETARCLADQQSESTGRQRPGWNELTNEEQNNMAGNIASIFHAMDQAMLNLDAQGLIPRVR